MKRRLQVFISSTYTDLIHERQAAVSAVLKSSHIPAGMELFTAADRSQMVTIKQWIDDSDVYMLILGGRYGTVEPTSGLSYTELEYDYAIQQNKPVFAVVTTEAALELKVKANGTTNIERDNPKELALFRKKVLSNISSFFEDSKDIKLCVHESLADFAANRDLKGWVSADEIQDTKPLFEEIRKLSDENRELKETISALEKKTAAGTGASISKQNEDFTVLSSVLSAIEIKVPAELAANGKEYDTTLLKLFYDNKEAFVTGVTNSGNASDAETFFFHNICPKLQVHGLIASEKVPGVRYRRSAVSTKGHSFLAEMERRLLLAKKPNASLVEASASTSSPSAVPAKRATPTAKKVVRPK
ncbi:DUF4062 domain-containing protein [Hydrogenophaga taeniospiralis]|uniref:DUF4062 domain-containing protein n=1 Tax=Hydrogenophaga taeniospiralis TaxID=65656 RepID=UPI001CFA5F08|nr:DUF4062 domain-containing protein [Hydrogenophaga taeniospiralis]MCB4364807.1 DUF4062 domain-containing protein [Hydrogenophaga taeniospiralis]